MPTLAGGARDPLVVEITRKVVSRGLTVIELAIEAQARVKPGQLALAASVGPGLSLEFLLLEWPNDG